MVHELGDSESQEDKPGCDSCYSPEFRHQREQSRIARRRYSGSSLRLFAASPASTLPRRSPRRSSPRPTARTRGTDRGRGSRPPCRRVPPSPSTGGSRSSSRGRGVVDVARRERGPEPSPPCLAQRNDVIDAAIAVVVEGHRGRDVPAVEPRDEDVERPGRHREQPVRNVQDAQVLRPGRLAEFDLAGVGPDLVERHRHGACGSSNAYPRPVSSARSPRPSRGPTPRTGRRAAT